MQWTPHSSVAALAELAAAALMPATTVSVATAASIRLIDSTCLDDELMNGSPFRRPDGLWLVTAPSLLDSSARRPCDALAHSLVSRPDGGRGDRPRIPRRDECSFTRAQQRRQRHCVQVRGHI